MGTVRSYQQLVVWRRAMELVTNCYRICSSFPHSERFGLASQITRAAVSIPANIAEGYGRGATGDYARFLSIARGSAMELETLLLISTRLGYADPDATEPLLLEVAEISRMLWTLRQRILETPRT